MDLSENFQIEIENSKKGLFENQELISELSGFVTIQQLYNAAIKEIRTKLEILDEEFHVKYSHNPIHHIESRLKSPKSIAEKLHRKGHSLSLSSIREYLSDVAGIRVICNYLDDIYRIADLLTNQDDIRLIRKKDYITHPKENGYRSLHLIVTVPIFLAESTENVPVEVQIRTIAMDFWASLEHQLKYKCSENVPDSIRMRLKLNAELLAGIDEEMQSIHKEIREHSNNSSVSYRKSEQK